ncbi:efflux RND transporter periplasmic adaptor subunit [Sphaerisporangium perillae]|uniref:efflux RND transporter periplasmic adaptor subunit n=1 Tax=Sphaerisporangium perillae TaxID=2935860 RepID=UPI00200D00CB|nr:peptidoglycan-binding protein [Sphaerisporangium perillae]
MHGRIDQEPQNSGKHPEERRQERQVDEMPARVSATAPAVAECRTGGRRGRTVLVTVLALAVTGTAGWAVLQVTTGGNAQPTPPAMAGPALATAKVEQADVAERRLVNGTLGYAGAYNVIISRSGVVTRLPAIGSTVKQGKAAYEIDGVRVPLLYGDRPAWRDLRVGVSNGLDVLQLESNLRALGFGKNLTVDQHFSYSTYYAVRRWQKAADLKVTGQVPLGQVVFAPAAIRIGGWDTKVGSVVAPGQLIFHGTSQAPAVLVQLSPAELPQIRVGDQVVVTLPDGKTRKGRIRIIGAVAVDGGTADATGSGAAAKSVAPVTIELTGKVRGFLDQAQVQVSIVTQQHKNVIAVPMTALLARPLGTYEVVVVEGGSRRRVPVETGLFDESTGMAEVTGDLKPGMLVEVPGDGS